MLRDVVWSDDGMYKVGDVYNPERFFSDALNNSSEFDLQLGYFSSATISVLATAFASFISKGGKIRLVINQIVSSKDKESITKGLGESPINWGLLAHFTQIYHLYNLLIYNILRRNLQLFITEFCIFSPCIIFISNKNSDKSIEILHISPKYITSVDNLMIHIFSSTFNFLYSFTPSDRLESKS